MTSIANADLTDQLQSELYTRHGIQVRTNWLTDFLSKTKQPPPPLNVLTSTAHFRLLNSDITQTLQSTTCIFPENITDVNVHTMTLGTNVPIQILTVEDVGSSKWSQIEAIERWEKGEEVRGREVIRNVPLSNESDESSTTIPTQSVKKSMGPHKVLLQDPKGTKVYGFEVGSVPRLFITNTSEEGGIDIGCKMILRKGCVVRRGLIMLKAEDVDFKGGKVEEWDKAWRKGRKERLRKEIESERARAENLSDG